MTTPPLDELYFQWLYSQVGSEETTNRSETYWGLLKLLFTKEFVWIIPNDDNRAEDGRDLRAEFLQDINFSIEVDSDWVRLGCSMLEMLIALSRRLSFEAEGEPRVWFWQLLENIDLRKYNDASEAYKEDIDEVLETVIWRTYSFDGSGGLFPLMEPREDQRRVELWYQMSAYLLEKF